MSKSTPIVPAPRVPPDPSLPAYFVPSAYISGRTGTVQFGHANNRPVHNGIFYRGEDNGRRAARRRIERQARREQRRAVRR